MPGLGQGPGNPEVLVVTVFSLDALNP